MYVTKNISTLQCVWNTTVLVQTHLMYSNFCEVRQSETGLQRLPGHPKDHNFNCGK